MKYGFILPGGCAYDREPGLRSEQAGWDGVFGPTVWAYRCMVALTARDAPKASPGTMISPLPRMRPWKVQPDATLIPVHGGSFCRWASVADVRFPVLQG